MIFLDLEALEAWKAIEKAIRKGKFEKMAAAPASVESQGIGRVKVIDLIESAQEEEPIGQDTPRRCDNRKSKSAAKFTIRASRTWRRQCTVQTERIRTAGGTAAVGLNKVVTANLQLAVQQAIHESSSGTNEMTNTFEQSFEVTVPPGVLQIVILDWKKIWRVGYIKLLVDGVHVEVPFRELKDIDYDQIHETIS